MRFDALGAVSAATRRVSAVGTPILLVGATFGSVGPMRGRRPRTNTQGGWHGWDDHNSAVPVLGDTFARSGTQSVE